VLYSNRGEVIMSLDIWLFRKKPYLVAYEDYGVATVEESESLNITHNLTAMANKVVIPFQKSGYEGDNRSLYELLWRPHRNGFTKVNDTYIGLLNDCLETLKREEEKLTVLNPPNGWGSYEGLVSFLERFISLCEDHKGWFINTST